MLVIGYRLFVIREFRTSPYHLNEIPFFKKK